MITRRFTSPLALVGILAAVSAGCTKAASSQIHPEIAAETGGPSAPVTVLPNPALTRVGAESIADIAERVLPSVVNISMTKVTKMSAPGMGFLPFFGSQGQEDRHEQGMGSGVIVSKDGYVLTNNHVVADAQEIKVTTSDRHNYDATVVGTDPKSDLAVIKIKGNVQNLTPVEFGDSGRLRLGDIVLAIGNPFGVGQTVTMGIVSAKGRSDLGIEAYEDFIQTDAAINPGNSGGALINSEGKLVGINTAILSRSGGYQGIGFAIPSNMASPIMDSLKKSGKVVRGWLGVAIQDVDQELADAMKLPSATGILLSDVKPGTPAAKSGLMRGDVVLKIDGKVVDTSGQFRNIIAASGSKHKVHLDFVRDGKAVAADVELGEMPDTDTAVAAGPSAAQGGALDGIVLENLNPQNRSNFEIDDNVKQGVVIARLDPQSNAARAGLRPGDVVLEVNRTRVDTPQKFQELYSKSKNRVLLLVNRHGSTTYLVVKG
ncbi:MAG TPA: DegQ family serine endoprotease [Polyangiaceae bacterium]|jgi:serine protease Do|nr:DegQ family serine endoprotease [Polyangiaceae bacterium]